MNIRGFPTLRLNNVRLHTLIFEPIIPLTTPPNGFYKVATSAHSHFILEEWLMQAIPAIKTCKKSPSAAHFTSSTALKAISAATVLENTIRANQRSHSSPSPKKNSVSSSLLCSGKRYTCTGYVFNYIGTATGIELLIPVDLWRGPFVLEEGRDFHFVRWIAAVIGGRRFHCPCYSLYLRRDCNFRFRPLWSQLLHSLLHLAAYTTCFETHKRLEIKLPGNVQSSIFIVHKVALFNSNSPYVLYRLAIYVVPSYVVPVRF